MYNFVINIEFGSQTYQDGNTAWVDKYIEDIVQHSELSEAQLKEYAEKIKESIERNLYSGNDFSGNPVKPLALSTIAKKGHSKVFFHTGELFRSIAMQKIPNGYEIFVLPNRAAIAYWLETGTNKMPARPFFGIIPERADSILDEIILRGYSKSGAAA